jgi:hypothetical protein
MDIIGTSSEAEIAHKWYWLYYPIAFKMPLSVEELAMNDKFNVCKTLFLSS